MKTPSQRRKQNQQTETEVQAARGRLRGALNDSLQGQEVDDISEDYEEDDKEQPQTPPPTERRPQRGRPRKIPATATESRTTFSVSPSITGNKKRRQRLREMASASGPNQQKMQAETFVMKLFDRSLDLSKYTEKTALYPICRAWMANQPRNPNIRSYREALSPPPSERVDNGDYVLSQLKSGDMIDIITMPKRKKSLVPKIPPQQPPKTYDKTQKLYEDNDPNTGCNKQELMAQHLSKWKGIKKNWQKHSKLHQKKNEVNFLILQELFKA